MRVVHGCTDVPPEAKGGVVAFGNFDGVQRNQS